MRKRRRDCEIAGDLLWAVRVMMLLRLAVLAQAVVMLERQVLRLQQG